MNYYCNATNPKEDLKKYLQKYKEKVMSFNKEVNWWARGNLRYFKSVLKDYFRTFSAKFFILRSLAFEYFLTCLIALSPIFFSILIN